MITAQTSSTYTTEIKSQSHSIIADEPTDLGGNNLGMNPNELLQASLASCTSITLKMYLNRKKWDISNIQVDISSDKEKPGSDLEIYKSIKLKGNVDQKQLDRLHYIAGRCPIHRILEKSVKIHSQIALI